MSRKGKDPVAVPKGVEVKLAGTTLSIKGPKGTLECTLRPEIELSIAEDLVVVSLTERHRSKKNFHGLFRSLIDNMVIGVTKGFSKELLMKGVGYRAAVQGSTLDLKIGTSHEVKLPIPTGIQVAVEKGTTIVVSGADKQAVGQFAANIREKRPPEPYQGKGIRYMKPVEEYVRRKAGKTAAKK